MLHKCIFGKTWLMPDVTRYKYFLLQNIIEKNNLESFLEKVYIWGLTKKMLMTTISKWKVQLRFSSLLRFACCVQFKEVPN